MAEGDEARGLRPEGAAAPSLQEVLFPYLEAL